MQPSMALLCIALKLGRKRGVGPEDLHQQHAYFKYPHGISLCDRTFPLELGNSNADGVQLLNCSSTITARGNALLEAKRAHDVHV